MSKNSKIKVKFSEYFNVNKSLLDEAELFDISLVSDLPLFIDPFHLFYSDKKEYKELHDKIIQYLVFLRDLSQEYEGTVPPTKILNTYYKFPEVKQNWLGFTAKGNSGRGLGREFAVALNNNFCEIFTDFGIKKKTHHLEKLTLIAKRVGKDTISDFTTNLIHAHLAKITEDFTKKHIQASQRQKITIKRAEFDFENKVWKPKQYVLPFIKGDYVLLTPKDLLTKHDTWINKGDFAEEFSQIPTAIEDEVLRQQLSTYFNKKLREYAETKLNKRTNKPELKITQKARQQAVIDTATKFPQAIDAYIKIKENKGNQAKTLSEDYVTETEQFLQNQFTSFAQNITQQEKPSSYQEALDRANYFKDCVELRGNYIHMYIEDKPATEDWIQRMFWLVWYGSESDVNREPKNGMGEPDFAVSQGRKDKTLIEFKLAKSRTLEKNLLNQLEKYKEADRTDKGVWVIIYFNKKERDKVIEILERNKLQNKESIILVDARKDNKTTASKIG